MLIPQPGPIQGLLYSLLEGMCLILNSSFNRSWMEGCLILKKYFFAAYSIIYTALITFLNTFRANNINASIRTLIANFDSTNLMFRKQFEI